jgi:hypothetical protein
MVSTFIKMIQVARLSVDVIARRVELRRNPFFFIVFYGSRRPLRGLAMTTFLKGGS